MDNEVYVFSMGDAAACAKAGQKVSKASYPIESLLKMLIRREARVRDRVELYPIQQMPQLGGNALSR